MVELPISEIVNNKCMLRNGKELPWKLGDGQSQGCPVEKEILYKRLQLFIMVNNNKSFPFVSQCSHM